MIVDPRGPSAATKRCSKYVAVPFACLLLSIAVGSLFQFLSNQMLPSLISDEDRLHAIDFYVDVAVTCLTAVLSCLLVLRSISRVHAEVRQQLEISEQRHRSLFEQHPDAVFSLNSLGRISSGNPASEHVSGYSSDEMIGRSFTDLLTPENKPVMEAHFAGTMEGQAQNVDVTIRHKQGHSIELNITSLPMVINGEIVGVFCIAKDVTERNRAEEERRATKEQLESFVNNTTDAIYSVDAKGFIRQVNRAFERIYGWRADEIIGQSLAVVLPEDRPFDADRFAARVRKFGSLPSTETKRKRKDGTVFDVSISVSPIHDKEGEILLFVSIARDITENKRVELALRESETKFRLIAEAVSDFISIFDTMGNHTYVSPSSLSLFGYAPEQMVGKFSFDYCHPDDREYTYAAFAEMMATKSPRAVEFRHERVGGYVLIEARGIPQLNEEGEIERVLVSASDITERKRTEELLRQQDKLAIAGQLAAGVAHEIRNPLTSIKGFAQLLRSRFTEYDHYFEIMLDELDRIEFIMNEFLVLAKPQALNFLQKDLRVLLQRLVALLETQAIINNVQISFECEEDLPHILCEENRLKQVFINLLKNSIEAMPTGGVVSIEVRRSGPQHVEVLVADQGCGIPQERIPRLGEPFYTTKEKGTGLGLMVSYKIIKDHQGDIFINSQLGQGTSVKITLPVEMKLPVEIAGRSGRP